MRAFTVHEQCMKIDPPMSYTRAVAQIGRSTPLPILRCKPMTGKSSSSSTATSVVREQRAITTRSTAPQKTAKLQAVKPSEKFRGHPSTTKLVGKSPTPSHIQRNPSSTSSNNTKSKRNKDPQTTAKPKAVRSSERLKGNPPTTLIRSPSPTPSYLELENSSSPTSSYTELEKSPSPTSSNKTRSSTSNSEKSPTFNRIVVDRSPQTSLTTIDVAQGQIDKFNQPPLPPSSSEHRVMASPMEENVGRTRESPLPPTKVSTPEIPYSQLLAGDEEEEILNWVETLNPSPTTPDKVQQLKKEILEHSKEMKTSLLLMTKADHHRAALKESLRTNKFPKGLTVHIQPHILGPDPVVLAEWSTAHTDFTRTLIQTLIRHYEKLVKIEREKQDSQRKQMLERIEQTQLSTKDAESNMKLEMETFSQE